MKSRLETRAIVAVTLCLVSTIDEVIKVPEQKQIHRNRDNGTRTERKGEGKNLRLCSHLYPVGLWINFFNVFLLPDVREKVVW